MRVSVRERLADLRGDLERNCVVDRSFPQGLPQRPAGYVLVGDVDVPGVARERVGALAARMTEPRGRRSLSLRPRSRLSLSRDDLERDLGSGRLVAGEPNRAGAAATERLQGAIPAENELVRGNGESRF